MISVRRVLVCCPNKITGGPELLHQLVDALRSLGREAYVVYFPFGEKYECPSPYKIYNSPQTQFEDGQDSLIVVPESATWILKRVHRAQGAVWWLSVDNYFGVQGRGHPRDLFDRYKSLIRHRLPLPALRNYLHFAQSQYASDFLRKNGISSFPLTDYLSEEHLSLNWRGTERRNIIVYNPKKGLSQTRRLQRANPDLEFVPIQDKTPAQVVELLNSAKIYIDFGHHPGKDRPPREAAMAGCCVITGIKGAAGNSVDISIPSEFKLDERDQDFPHAFRRLVNLIFDSYEEYGRCFESYKDEIRKEPARFRHQVKSLFVCGPAADIFEKNTFTKKA